MPVCDSLKELAAITQNQLKQVKNTGILTSKDAHVESSINVGELVLKNRTSCMSCRANKTSLPFWALSSSTAKTVLMLGQILTPCAGCTPAADSFSNQRCPALGLYVYIPLSPSFRDHSVLSPALNSSVLMQAQQHLSEYTVLALPFTGLLTIIKSVTRAACSAWLLKPTLLQKNWKISLQSPPQPSYYCTHGDPVHQYV